MTTIQSPQTRQSLDTNDVPAPAPRPVAEGFDFTERNPAGEIGAG